jgi:hypothetical protein
MAHGTIGSFREFYRKVILDKETHWRKTHPLKMYDIFQH